MTAIIVFGVILLICSAEVIRLARDARADMDSEYDDVFDRRRETLRAAARRGCALLRDGRALVRKQVAAREQRRDLPTIPALPRR